MKNKFMNKKTQINTSVLFHTLSPYEVADADPPPV